MLQLQPQPAVPRRLLGDVWRAVHRATRQHAKQHVCETVTCWRVDGGNVNEYAGCSLIQGPRAKGQHVITKVPEKKKNKKNKIVKTLYLTCWCTKPRNIRLQPTRYPTRYCFYRRVDVLAKLKSTGCARGSFLEKYFLFFKNFILDVLAC